jgi:NADH:ubiquinone oxidoreductase subunit F (NADH-binding)
MTPGPPAGLPRLLAGLGPDGGRVDLARHLQRWGWPWPASWRPGSLIAEIERSGLRGRGGAAFPAGVKWRAVSSRRMRGAVVVANGAEREPASGKDRLLLARAPHLVLDGASLAGAAVGAVRVIAYVPADVVPTVTAAAAERARRGLDPTPIEVVPAAGSFVAGEESAVVDHLNGGPGGRPTFTAVRPVYQRGVQGRPTLVQNVETLAHAALISRFGAAWFRGVGTAESPGSALLTVSGAGRPPAVTEIALGTPLAAVLRVLDTDPSSVGAVLMGGFGGTWLAAGEARHALLSAEGLRPLGAAFGAGVIGVLPPDACPLAETAHISAYLAAHGAGQCGPCVRGLPALAAVAAALAWQPSRQTRLVERAGHLAGQISGRGACHHPDGAVRLVQSTLRTFADHVDAHLNHGPCPGAGAPPVLPVPDARGRRRLAGAGRTA